MTTWRKKEQGAARHRQKRDDNETKKYVTVHGNVKPPKKHQLA